MRSTVAALAATLMLGSSVALAAPASAHGDKQRLEEMRQQLLAEPEGTPVLSDNVQHLATLPGQVAISGCFLQTAPLFVTSGVDSIRVLDVSDGTAPTEVGVLPQGLFENEAMNCGERTVRGDETQRFALVGVDLVATTPTQPEHYNLGGGELRIIDVTDPTNPVVRSTVPGTTSTHTVACVEETNCRYAYSAGDSDGSFSIFDLRDLDHPVEVDGDPATEGVQPFTSPTSGHKWNFDGTGYGSHTGWNGTSIWKVTKPRHPKLVETTGKAGRGEGAKGEGFNDFIHHNSVRINAENFKPNSKPSIKHGNILLVTEEDYEQTDCSLAGSFQTWHIKRLNGKKSSIVPLDKVELSDLQAEQPGTVPLPQGTFCSAHWFDYRPGGIVAIGYYGGGTQFIDVRKPKHLHSYGYAYWGASEVWDTMWLPVYDDRGRQTRKTSNVAYSIDLARGLDVYSVDVPGDGRGAAPDPAVSPSRTRSGISGNGVLPLGLVGGALALTVAVRRRTRRV